MEHKVPAQVLKELQDLLTVANSAKKEVDLYARAAGLSLGVDMNDPKVQLDFQKGCFVSPDPDPAVEEVFDPPVVK
jgi:hypothetical protein